MPDQSHKSVGELHDSQFRLLPSPASLLLGLWSSECAQSGLPGCRPKAACCADPRATRRFSRPASLSGAWERTKIITILVITVIQSNSLTMYQFQKGPTLNAYRLSGCRPANFSRLSLLQVCCIRIFRQPKIHPRRRFGQLQRAAELCSSTHRLRSSTVRQVLPPPNAQPASTRVRLTGY